MSDIIIYVHHLCLPNQLNGDRKDNKFLFSCDCSEAGWSENVHANEEGSESSSGQSNQVV